MKEKLIIKNFGPIKNIELDLGKVTVLIGEQATGKSTVAKVLAVCRYFSYIVDVFPEDHNDVFKQGIVAWGLSEYVKKNTYIFYSCKHYTVEYDCFTYIDLHLPAGEDTPVEYEQGQFTYSLTPISQEFNNLLHELSKITPENNEFGGLDSFELDEIELGQNWIIPTSFFQNDVAKVLDNPFYLPTERGLQSIFSIGKTSIANLSDSLFSQLAKMDGIARLFKKETYIEPLDIYYVNRNGHGFIRKANEETFYSLFNAASGYQAIIPIVLTVKYYTELKKKTKTLLIEEPELDVFPGTQNKLVQYLVEKSKVHNSMMFLTTHSPYTLTALNNLMYAHTVGKMDKEQVNAVIEEKYWVNPDDVSVYMMKTDGTAENIIDEEGLIRAEKIDDVSKKLNAVFSDLMDIEIDNAERN